MQKWNGMFLLCQPEPICCGGGGGCSVSVTLCETGLGCHAVLVWCCCCLFYHKLAWVYTVHSLVYNRHSLLRKTLISLGVPEIFLCAPRAHSNQGQCSTLKLNVSKLQGTALEWSPWEGTSSWHFEPNKWSLGYVVHILKIAVLRACSINLPVREMSNSADMQQKHYFLSRLQWY